MKVKRILAVLGLISMAVFLGSILFYMVQGKLKEGSAWIIGSLSAFVCFGAAALVIDSLQKRAKAQRAREEKAASSDETDQTA